MDDQIDRVQQEFGARAEDYATSPVHAQGPSLVRLIALTQPQRDWIVLDVATGAGHTALTFAPHVTQVVAVDLTREMLATAQRLATERGLTNIEFKTANAENLPFDANTFNVVTSRMALHHYSDARKAIQEMARVCKPHGLVALVDNIVPPDKQVAGYINHYEKMRDPSHNWAFPVARLQALFADAELELVHTETFSKEIEFEPWADRTKATPETKAKLLERLAQAPEGAREFLAPRTEGTKTYFALTEAILIGRKG